MLLFIPSDYFSGAHWRAGVVRTNTPTIHAAYAFKPSFSPTRGLLQLLFNKSNQLHQLLLQAVNFALHLMNLSFESIDLCLQS
jgi:hypothetical protein